MEDAPWPNWGKNRKEPGLTQRDLAALLRPYEIKPKDHRFEEGAKKGYLREQFEGEWERYLPAPGGLSA